MIKVKNSDSKNEKCYVTWLSLLMHQFSHSVVAAHLGGGWIESRLGRKCLYGQIYQILLAVDNSSPAIYVTDETVTS